MQTTSSHQSVTIVGVQFGDESKGSITDLLAQEANVVARYNGGSNAGHTIVINGKKFKLSSLPSGILTKGVINIIGSGMVLDPKQLKEEMDKVREAGIEITPANLKIAENVPLVLPIHKDLEALQESGSGALNTTKKGIGPAYEDKVGRRAIRARDLVKLSDPKNLAALKEKIKIMLEHHNALLRGFGKEPVKEDEVLAYVQDYAPLIEPFVTVTWRELDVMQKAGKKMLIEGAQSAWLDISHGTYPYVTSSHTTASAAGYGLGIALKDNYVLGVVKAYTTRVGNGPFPTILTDDTGEKIRQIGQEFGAVTGRKRDCGWLDLVSVKQAIVNNGVHALALAKGDVLDGFETIKVCIGYKVDGQEYDHMPIDPASWDKIEPIYKEFKGWSNTKGVRDHKQLNENYHKYIKFIEEFTGVPVVIISTGPDRQDKIILKDPFNA
ncbi:MAG TPA: adenylosuccinate synthase [Candidatus Nitrosotenuis sp.]|nr:adenylosuccinate synthase [Candidatus Nitrosotenuis sp.]